MDNPIISLESVAIITNNLPQMVRFYDEVFNAQLEPITLGDVILYEGQIGTLKFALSPDNIVQKKKNQRGRCQLTFFVSELEEIVIRAKDNGGFQLYDIRVFDAEKYCAIADPDGNSIELIESQPIANPKISF